MKRSADLFFHRMIVAAFPIALLLSSIGSAAEQKAAEPAKVRGLLQDRLAVIEEMQGLATKSYEAGQVGIDEVHQAHLAILDAQLDLAESPQDRVKIYENMVRVAGEHQPVVERLAEAHEVSRLDILKAKAHLLKLRIGLERASAEQQ